MTKIINTSVPIPIEYIRSYFRDKDTFFYLDYASSKIKNKPFLTYIGNNGIPSDIIISEEVSESERFQLVKDFMEIRVIVNAPILIHTVAAIMVRSNGLDPEDSFEKNMFSTEQLDAFIADNKELVDRWNLFLHSCMLYLIYTCSDIDKEVNVKDEHEHIDDINYIGLNVCQLFAVEDFYMQFISGTIPEKLYFFTQQFEEPIFRGSKLIRYFSVDENPFYAILLGMVQGELPITPIDDTNFEINEAIDG